MMLAPLEVPYQQFSPILKRVRGNVGSVKYLKAVFYKRYIDNTYAKRKRDETDKLFDVLNSYYPNIKLIVEENPTKILNTKITRENRKRKNNSISPKKPKYPVPWLSKVPLCYKKNRELLEKSLKYHSVIKRMESYNYCRTPYS